MRGWTRFDRRDADQRQLLGSATTPMEQLFYAHDDRVAAKWHHYLALYDRHLEHFRSTPVRLLELGVLHGGSLQLWRKYFGELAVLHGIDIDERSAQAAEPGLVVHIGDASDAHLLESVIDEMGGVDVVIDDASHIGAHQVASFSTLWPRLSARGVYLCEDTHANYWPTFSGGYLETSSFIEYTKRLIDRMHAWYVDDERLDRDETFARECRGIHIYDSMVVFEKDTTRGEPFHTMVGKRKIVADDGAPNAGVAESP